MKTINVEPSKEYVIVGILGVSLTVGARNKVIPDMSKARAYHCTTPNLNEAKQILSDLKKDGFIGACKFEFPYNSRNRNNELYEAINQLYEAINRGKIDSFDKLNGVLSRYLGGFDQDYVNHKFLLTCSENLLKKVITARANWVPEGMDIGGITSYSQHHNDPFKHNLLYDKYGRETTWRKINKPLLRRVHHVAHILQKFTLWYGTHANELDIIYIYCKLRTNYPIGLDAW